MRRSVFFCFAVICVLYRDRERTIRRLVRRCWRGAGCDGGCDWHAGASVGAGPGAGCAAGPGAGARCQPAAPFPFPLVSPTIIRERYARNVQSGSIALNVFFASAYASSYLSSCASSVKRMESAFTFASSISGDFLSVSSILLPQFGHNSPSSLITRFMVVVPFP